MKLTADNVRTVMLDCLFKEHEAKDNFIAGIGVTGKFGFHPARLQQNKPSIKSMLEQLPDQFFEDKGGGWSFLNACNDKEGTQWGEHRDMEALFALGYAAGFVAYPFARDMWSSLPGGVPYITINLKEKADGNISNKD